LIVGTETAVEHLLVDHGKIIEIRKGGLPVDDIPVIDAKS